MITFRCVDLNVKIQIIIDKVIILIYNKIYIQLIIHIQIIICNIQSNTSLTVVVYFLDHKIVCVQNYIIGW